MYCPECGTSYANPYEVLDDAQCGVRLTSDTWCMGRLTSAEAAIRSLARARATAHADGVAAERADIVAWLRGQVSTVSGAGVFTTDVLAMVAEPIRHGCHVGAAKRGGG